ncbi:PRC-barrel domain-containing protein [Salipiger mucosus]|uniref:PRC-barrel domain-containing protein n=1 Tax=Salipiger mucosus DSM 16094 TaxID=1123237 RepID=S9QFU7_9RHOB|nr:PRC-barrel domain-containing protein [Salipiger mucosus]EPX78473.1 hypothetical protein Salmuc_03583 [Salipiger mucosus DSM 16094]
MMTRLTTTAAVIALTAGTAAYADSHDGDAMEQTEQSAEQTMESAGETVENAGEATANAAEDAGEATADAAEEMGEDVEQAAENAAAEGEQAMEEAGDEMAEAGEEMEQEAEEMANDAESLFANDTNMIRTRDITGGAVYAIDAEGGETDWDSTTTYDSVNSDWDNVGTIEDIVLNADGSFKGIVAEVGGFLDIGDKHVMIEINDAKFVPVEDQTYAVVTNFTADELDSMEGVDEAPYN